MDKYQDTPKVTRVVFSCASVAYVLAQLYWRIIAGFETEHLIWMSTLCYVTMVLGMFTLCGLVFSDRVFKLLGVGVAGYVVWLTWLYVAAFKDNPTFKNIGL